MSKWVYGTEVRVHGGDHVVSVRDLPEVVTSGDDEADALAQVADAIEAALVFRIKRGEPLPAGSPVRDGEHAVVIAARLAAKASVYEAWRESGITKRELASRMGRNEAEVRRILDPGYGTKLEQLDEAAEALGQRLTIGMTRRTAARYRGEARGRAATAEA